MSEPKLFLPVDQAYDRWSRFYDTYDNPLVFAASQVMERVAERVAGLDVFEFGCGTGRNLALLKRAGAGRLAGCDFSSGMLAQARKANPDLALLQHDITQPLPLDVGCADLALFCLTLEHIGDFEAALRNAVRLVRPDGSIIIIEIHPFLALLDVAAHFYDDATLVEMPTFPHSFAEYLTAAANAGLRVSECREWRPRDLRQPVPAKLLKRGPDIPLLVEFTLCPEGRER